jgi:hypothetical protein
MASRMRAAIPTRSAGCGADGPGHWWALPPDPPRASTSSMSMRSTPRREHGSPRTVSAAADPHAPHPLGWPASRVRRRPAAAVLRRRDRPGRRYHPGDRRLCRLVAHNGAPRAPRCAAGTLAGMAAPAAAGTSAAAAAGPCGDADAVRSGRPRQRQLAHPRGTLWRTRNDAERRVLLARAPRRLRSHADRRRAPGGSSMPPRGSRASIPVGRGAPTSPKRRPPAPSMPAAPGRGRRADDDKRCRFWFVREAVADA